MSWVAFSPSRVNRGSPARTRSPSCLSQPAKIPSSMFQPRRGTVMATAMSTISLRDEIPDGPRDRIRVGDDGRFQRGAVGGRGLRPVQATDRRIEVVEAAVGDPGGDLGTQAE